MDEANEKTEQATPQKIRDAQQKGIALRSPELSVLIGLVIGAIAILALIPVAAHHTTALAQHWIGQAATAPGLPDSQSFRQLAAPSLNLLLALFAASTALLVLAAAAYGGIHFSGFPMKPDFSRLNPAKGFKRIFSMHTLTETAKASLKVAALIGLIWFLAVQAVADLAVLQVSATAPAAAVLAKLALKVVGWLIALQLLFTVFDLWYANRKYLKQLRMSRHDIKDEYKRQEGDPDMKQKRKRIQSALLAQIKALGSVKDSDVIVTNPTHVSVALRYRPGEMDAPVIACAGRGNLALLIRILARRHRVPILRQPALARALAANARPGDQIAREHQQQVVYIYRWLLARPNNPLKLAR